MGLLDVLNGMQNGPRGPSKPGAPSEGGMSPMTMAIMALLAWKAMKHFGGSQPGASPAPAPSAGPLAKDHQRGHARRQQWRRWRIERPLEGRPRWFARGRRGGQHPVRRSRRSHEAVAGGRPGDAANSWVGKGQNKAIAPGDLANALGADQIDAIASQAGMSRNDLLQGLSQYLPDVIDHLDAGRTAAQSERTVRTALTRACERTTL